MDRAGELVVTEVEWQEKASNAWLLREIYDLLLRDPDEAHAERGPDLTQKGVSPRMELQAIVDDKGGQP